jgi:hypothetical protein
MTISTLAATSAPVSAAVRSPSLQKQVDTALNQLSKQTSIDSNGEITIDMTARKLTDDGSSGSGRIHIDFSTRKQPSGTTTPNSEGRIALDQLTVQSQGGTPGSINLDAPAAIQWKVVNNTFYGRIEELPTLLTQALKGAGGQDPSSYIGMWGALSKTDAEALLNNFSLGPTHSLSPALPSQEQVDIVENLKSMSVIQVHSVESRWTDAAGHSIVRVRGQINPAIVPVLKKIQLSTIAASDPQRASKIQATTIQFNKMQQLLKGVQVAVNLDQTTDSIERIEFGGTTNSLGALDPVSQAFPSGSQTRQTTAVNVHYAVGISYSKDNGQPISVPSNTVSLKDLISNYFSSLTKKTST